MDQPPVQEGVQPAGIDLAQERNARQQRVDRVITAMTHACACNDTNCQSLSCQKLKRLGEHSKICLKNGVGGCNICKQLIGLCLYHAKVCKEQTCPWPYCIQIKHKLRQHQLRRLQQINAFNQSLLQAANSGSGTKKAPVQPFDIKPAQKLKKWHKFVSSLYRVGRVKKIVKAISSIRDPHSLIDKRNHNLGSYARKIEVRMYEKADSVDEYDGLIDQKINFIEMGMALANSKPSAG